jgi:hypothetical protein
MASGIFYGHLVLFVAKWLYFSRFGMLYQEKSGNPGFHLSGSQPEGLGVHMNQKEQDATKSR